VILAKVRYNGRRHPERLARSGESRQPAWTGKVPTRESRADVVAVATTKGPAEQPSVVWVSSRTGDTMSDSDTPEPLRSIPIQIVVDGIDIIGEILFARFNDMSVVIHSPASGLGTGLHVPWFRYGYPQFALATRTALTERGVREANWLLKELFDYSRGRRSGWGISRVSADGRWTEIAQDD
jgi:hypothetical protein